MARVWIAEQELHCSLRIGTYHEAREDGAAPEHELWGRILSDMTQHIARAMQEAYGVDADEFVDRVRDFYLHELAERYPGLKGTFIADSN